MPEPVKVAVIYYSATGGVHTLAEAVARGAEEAGAEVRLRQVHELAPAEAIASNQGWAAHRARTESEPVAELTDLEWADVVVFGTPTRFGLPSAQLKQFIDTAGGLWAGGQLADKVYSSFVSAGTAHGGQESTLLALNNVFYHWGGIIVPPGYTDAIQFQSGNPYGTSHVSNNGATPPGEVEVATAAYQGRRSVEVAARLKGGVTSAEAPEAGAAEAGVEGVTSQTSA